MTEIKAVVFDIGGVLTKDFPKNSFCRKWTAPTTIKELRKQFGSGNVPINEFISQGSKFMNMDQESFLTEYNKTYGNVRPKRNMVELFLNIKIPRYIFSDTNPLHAPILKERLRKVFSSAEKVWLSNEVKMRKVDLTPFLFMIKEIRRKPHEILFIDNSEDIIKIARSTGIKTILFKNYSQLKNDLTKLGIK